MRRVPISPDELMDHARAAQASAYAPYSGFHVGAAAEADDGTVYTGANVENASSGLSICAERVAVCSAVAAGARRLTALAVSAGNASAAPCGACRQFIAEFGDAETRVSFYEEGVLVTQGLADLLPHPFRLRRSPSE